eukprot:scaffold4955_cov53-Phaeocystis_antarctica.AAC.1
MGSRRRLRLSGTGSRLAALTDFHTTSYSAEVPRRQLSNALAALGEIAFEPQLQPGRVAREQRAVLAEATTLGTAAYRRAQLVLSALHAETLLPRRLPIGDSSCVASATPRGLRAFHTAHVTPHKAEVYVVGAVTPRRARRLVRRALGGASGGEAGRGDVQRGRPQVRHTWGGAARVAVHEEEGLRAVSVNWQRKRRLRAVRDEAGVREAALEEVAVEVLRARLLQATRRGDGSEGVGERAANAVEAVEREAKDEGEAKGVGVGVGVEVEVEVRDSAAERCALLCLALDAPPSHWYDAAARVAAEMASLRRGGATEAEVAAAARAVVRQAEAGARTAAGSPEATLAALLAADAAGDVCLAPEAAAAAVREAVAHVGPKELQPTLLSLIDGLQDEGENGREGGGRGQGESGEGDGGSGVGDGCGSGEGDEGGGGSWGGGALVVCGPPGAGISAAAVTRLLLPHRAPAPPHGATPAPSPAPAPAPKGSLVAPPAPRTVVTLQAPLPSVLAFWAVPEQQLGPPWAWVGGRAAWRARRRSPLHARCALLLLQEVRNAPAAHPFPDYHPQEVLNARLFTRLRDELGLVYTASVRFGPDAPAGGGDDSGGGGDGDGGSSCTLSLVAAPPDAARARREAAALLWRLSS